MGSLRAFVQHRPRGPPQIRCHLSLQQTPTLGETPIPGLRALRPLLGTNGMSIRSEMNSVSLPRVRSALRQLLDLAPGGRPALGLGIPRKPPGPVQPRF